jgi:protein SCO1/2
MSGGATQGSGLIGRRRLGLLAAGLVAGRLVRPALADDGWHNIDVTGTSMPLQLSMTRARDAKHVTQADYGGDVVLLYFGYTFCPDVCPLTLSNLTQAVERLGKQAAHVRILFVTVDPNRDSLAVLKQYAAAFSPQIDGLRGTPDELAALARRYRIAYSVTPASADHPYEVTHSSAIYAFDAKGEARLLIPSMASQDPDIDGTMADLRRLIFGSSPPGIVSRLFEEVLRLI